MSKHSDLFRDLTLRTWIDTDLAVISVAMTYDTKQAICIVNELDDHFELRGYSLADHKLCFKQSYHGEYLKMNTIEQSDCGTIFAIAY